MIAAAIVITGVATIYAEPYIGQPLYCDHGQGLTYSLAASSPLWVALDVSLYQSGRVRCGDEIWLTFGSLPGQIFKALALDAGPLARYHIADWPARRIVVDIPAFQAPFPGLSTTVTLVNHSEAKRQLEGRLAQ